MGIDRFSDNNNDNNNDSHSDNNRNNDHHHGESHDPRNGNGEWEADTDTGSDTDADSDADAATRAMIDATEAVPLTHDLIPPDAWAALAGRFGLSRREVEVIQLLFDGHCEAGIAYRLDISRHTVHTYIRRVYAKLGVDSYSHTILAVMAAHIDHLTAAHEAALAEAEATAASLLPEEHSPGTTSATTLDSAPARRKKKTTKDKPPAKGSGRKKAGRRR